VLTRAAGRGAPRSRAYGPPGFRLEALDPPPDRPFPGPASLGPSCCARSSPSTSSNAPAAWAGSRSSPSSPRPAHRPKPRNRAPL